MRSLTPSAPPPPATTTTVRPIASAASPAAPLAFDPPIVPQAAAPSAPPDLSRDTRGTAATNGVVESSTSKYDVSTYLRDTTDNGDYDQESVTQRTGTVHH
jgi:hypothetical protein